MVDTELVKMLEVVRSRVSELLDTSNFCVALYDDVQDRIEFVLATSDGREQRVGEGRWEARPCDPRGLIEYVVNAQEPVLVAEEFDKWIREHDLEYAMDKHLQSCLGVPMVVGGKCLGAIIVESPEKRAFDEGDLVVLLNAASQASICIENNRLYGDLSRRVKYLQALNEVGQTLTAGIRLRQDEILELIYEQAQKLTGAQDMYIALYDEETGMIRFGLATEHGERVHYEPRQADMEKRGKTEEVIFAGEPILHRTLAESRAWYGQPGHQEFIGRVSPSWLGVPMVVGERVLGMIAIYDWEREYAYDEQDLQVFSSMASQAAIALDNAQLYERARSEAIAARQLATLGTAIAALQHRINNTFNIIVPNVTRLRKRVDMTDETIVQILDIIERNARYTSDIIARIQEPLREVEIQDVDINAVLSDVVARVKEQWQADLIRSAIEVTLNLDDSIPQIQAPIGQVAEVFRNLVDNAYRAMKKGGTLTVTSQRADGMIQVRVQDTGCGIPPAVQKRLFVKPVPSKEPGEGAGLGLWLSRLILQSIGGDVKIERSDPTGTTMLVQIP